MFTPGIERSSVHKLKTLYNRAQKHVNQVWQSKGYSGQSPRDIKPILAPPAKGEARQRWRLGNMKVKLSHFPRSTSLITVSPEVPY